MGVVYRAWQVRLRRVVALKMILAGDHAGPEAAARFRVEAEAVARLQHPHIVQIYEVGEHDGRPYVALEYVDGGSLKERLTGAPQPARPTAELVETLARAMHHAHRQGIVHRDLKPANVLVTAEGTPKITDFGLAKLLVGGAEVHTQTGAVLGTPSYMAPEQAGGKGKEIGPAVDVYGLGAILYELLTGRPPFRGETPLETLQQVQWEEPVPPSRLQPRLPRDLSTICLKCLQKEPRKRYPSAEALAEDLRRFREGRPIVARPVGVGGRALKWAKRKPAVAALLSALASVATGSVLGLAGLWLHADRQRARAEDSLQKAQTAEATAAAAAAQEKAEADKARVVSEFLVNLFRASGTLDMEGYFRSSPERGERLTLRELLDQGARKVKTLKVQPAVRAALLDAMGNAYRSLGMAGKAIPLLEEALEIRLRLLEEAPLPDPVQAHLDVAASLHNLAWAHHHRGDYDKAEGLYRKALTIRRRHKGDDDLQATSTLLNLAWLRAEGQDYKEAERLFREVIATRRRQLGNDHPEVALARLGLATLLLHLGRDSEAAATGLEAMQILHKDEGENTLVKALGLGIQGVRQRRSKQYPEAVSSLHKCLAITRVLLKEHLYVAVALNELAVTLEEEGRYEEAEGYYRECLATVRATVGYEHPWAILAVNGSARLLSRKGKYPEGEALYREVVARRRERFGERHSWVAEALVEWARYIAAHQQGKEADNRAERLLEEANPILRHNAGRFPNYPVHLHLYGAIHDGSPAHIYHTTFSPDSRFYLASGDGHTARLYDVTTGRQRQELVGHRHWVQCAVFTPDRKQVLTGSMDATVRLWKVTADQAEALPAVGAGTAAGAFSPRGVSPFVAAAALITGTSDEVRRFEGHTQPVHGVAVTPDGKAALSGSDDGTLRLWELATGREAARLQGHAGKCSGTFSPDGRQVLSYGGDGTLRLWDVATGREVRRFEGHQGEVWGGHFLPGGRQIVSYGQDKTLRAWDVGSGKEVRQPVALGDDLAGDRSVAVTPDGKRFLSLHTDRTLRLRDVASGEIRHRFELHHLFRGTGTPRGVSISPDGRYAACGSYRGLVYLFRLPAPAPSTTTESGRPSRPFVLTHPMTQARSSHGRTAGM
jgi:tetratricopeptide (TPR) repeat protein